MERGVHLAALRAGGEHDALDQPPYGLRRLVAVARVGQRLGEPLHLAAVDVRDLRVDVGHVDRNGGEALVQLVLPGLQFAHAVHHAPRIAAVLDHRDHGLDLLLDVGQLLPVRRARSAALAVEPVGLLGIRLHRLGGGLGGHQLLPEPCHDPLLDLDSPDAPAVGARARHDVAGAAVAVLAALGVGAAAHAALQKTRQQIAGPVGAAQPVGLGRARGRDGRGVFLRDFPLPGLRGLPQFVVHDSELGNLGDDPFLGRVDPRDPLAGVRVLQHSRRRFSRE